MSILYHSCYLLVWALSLSSFSHSLLSNDGGHQGSLLCFGCVATILHYTLAWWQFSCISMVWWINTYVWVLILESRLPMDQCLSIYSREMRPLFAGNYPRTFSTRKDPTSHECFGFVGKIRRCRSRFAFLSEKEGLQYPTVRWHTTHFLLR